MAEPSRTTQGAQSDSKSPSPTPTNVSVPGVGSIVLVRNTPSSVVPAIITNDFSDGNAPGVVSLVVFNAADFNNVVVKAVPQAQLETNDIPAEDLSRELFVWWMPLGSDLAKRDLQKEIDAKRAKPKEDNSPQLQQSSTSRT